MRLACQLILSLLSTLVISTNAVAQKAEFGETVSFVSAVYPPTPFQLKQAKKNNNALAIAAPLRLEGYLNRPSTEGPHPAIVLLHGCAGIGRWNEVWTVRLVAQGYVVLNADSFQPRGRSYVCARPWEISPLQRTLDAHGAKTFLEQQPFVDRNKIAVMGMSHGGWPALQAASSETTANLKTAPFAAAISFYPWCDYAEKFAAPVLILTGELDDWSPVKRCRVFVSKVPDPGNITLKIYADAHHLFDIEGIDSRVEGHVLRHHPEAAADAYGRVLNFLRANF